MEERGKIICKKSDNKAFKLGENWYNLNDNVIPFLEKMSKGDEVVVTFEKKGVSRYVSKLAGAGATETPKTETTSTTGFVCEVCNAPLKDGRFKVCYMCNKKGLKAPTKKEDTKSDTPEPRKPYTPYDNPEKTEQIRRGNALNAAGAAISGNLQGTDPDTLAQALIMVAERALEWLKNE